MLTRVKVITSHSGLARFLGECEPEPVGVIDRQPEIPSPYHYSSEWAVWRHQRLGTVTWSEVRHKRYEVFQVPAGHGPSGGARLTKP